MKNCHSEANKQYCNKFVDNEPRIAQWANFGFKINILPPKPYLKCSIQAEN